VVGSRGTLIDWKPMKVHNMITLCIHTYTDHILIVIIFWVALVNDKIDAFQVDAGNSIISELTKTEISKKVGHFGYFINYTTHSGMVY